MIAYKLLLLTSYLMTIDHTVIPQYEFISINIVNILHFFLVPLNIKQITIIIMKLYL